MPEPTLPDRLVTAAMGAMPVEISNPRDAAAITVAVLRELHDAGYQTITMDGFGLETDINRVADEIEAIAANPTITDTSDHGVAHHRHRTSLIREAVHIRAKAARIPTSSHLTVTLHYAPGDNRRRDADNLWPTLKAACDALARGPRRDWVGLDLVPDDTPQHMTKHAPVIHPGKGERRLWIEVEITR